jgi:hypothetical protein
VLRAAAAAAAVALAAGAAAGAATPAQQLARQLKASLQAYYARTQPGLVITSVACSIPAGGATGTCRAQFRRAAMQAEGVFVIGLRIDRGTGSVATRTLSVSCRDARTGVRLRCL